jgi:hypothetical protein
MGVRSTTFQKKLQAIAEVYVHARPEGILSVSFLNDNRGRKNVRPGDVQTMIEKHTWRGVSRIGTELKRKILDNLVYEPNTVPRELKVREKPLLIMTITDGQVILCL